jgi:hypothetical protein
MKFAPDERLGAGRTGHKKSQRTPASRRLYPKIQERAAKPLASHEAGRRLEFIGGKFELEPAGRFAYGRACHKPAS